MNVKLNKAELRDKILACWIGKNIGGTIGGPYEGGTEMWDITGFKTAKGEPLPNDDLDLQIAWLMTLERVGVKYTDANALAHSWLMYLTPFWNEYGIAQKNLKMGLLPPLSGEYDNKLWRNSNGAWIRSEIWASLAPGFPNIAVKYAIMDASVDHGLGEGTYSAIFTAAMESIAFVEKDVRKIVETALTYIPEDTRTAQCVRCVLEEYDKGTPYRETREKIVEMTKDLGWFQAPNNIGFTVIGLIYGEGDFKNSIIYAVNCGDDTDCTAGTVGALLGIVGGTAGIPKDWQEYIGDRIIQICINPQYLNDIPKNCNDFTDRVMRFIPEILSANDVCAEFTDGDAEYNKEEAFKILESCASDYYKRKPLSYDVNIPGFLTTRVEFDKEPVVSPNEEFKFTVKFKQLISQEALQGAVSVALPEGWSAQYRKSIHIAKCRDVMEVSMPYKIFDIYSDLDVTIIPNENIKPVNKLYVNVEIDSNPIPLTIPVTLLG